MLLLSNENNKASHLFTLMITVAPYCLTNRGCYELQLLNSVAVHKLA